MKKRNIVLLMIMVIVLVLSVTACDNSLDTFGVGEYYNAKSITYSITVKDGDDVLSSIVTEYETDETGMLARRTITKLNEELEGDTYTEEVVEEHIDKADVQASLPKLDKLKKEYFLEGYTITEIGDEKTLTFSVASPKDYFDISEEEAAKITDAKVEAVYNGLNPTSYTASYILGENVVEIKIIYRY